MENSLAKFSKLNRNTFLFKSQAPQTNSPISLVILCTWVGARPKHIEKYTEKYQAMYPAADIMILTSSIADMSYRSNRSQCDALQLARDAVLSYRRANSVLLHAFSNGGAQCAVQLAASLPIPERERAFNAIILDSCPGVGSYQRSALAMKLSLPRGFIQQTIGTLLIHLTLMILFFCDHVLGIENAVSDAGDRLLYPTIFPADVPRLYVYSKKDDMVPDGDVHEHAERARRHGYWDVREVVFEESKHCAHAGRYGEEYWGAVEKIVRR